MAFLEGQRPYTQEEINEHIKERVDTYEGFDKLSRRKQAQLKKQWEQEVRETFKRITPNQ